MEGSEEQCGGEQWGRAVWGRAGGEERLGERKAQNALLKCVLLKCSQLKATDHSVPARGTQFALPTPIPPPPPPSLTLASLCSMIRFDMSEYMEKQSVSRLIGSPPGYVGYEEGGQLTDAVRRKPYSLILFDEMEKAHRDVLNVLLQVLDDGRLTDGKGTQVNFRNTVVVFTSNVGSSAIMDLARTDGDGVDQGEMRARVTEAMRMEFTPEFLNRNEAVIFKSLGREDLRSIVALEMKGLGKRLLDKGIKMVVEDAALDYLAEVGFDGVFGARPLKRVIQREVEVNLSKKILSDDMGEGDEVVVRVGGDERIECIVASK